MKLDVNYDELKELSTFVETKYEEIDKVLNEIKDLINDVDENWKGNDATVFVTKAKYYVDKDYPNAYLPLRHSGSGSVFTPSG